jgi:hypothetical protein
MPSASAAQHFKTLSSSLHPKSRGTSVTRRRATAHYADCVPPRIMAATAMSLSTARIGVRTGAPGSAVAGSSAPKRMAIGGRSFSRSPRDAGCAAVMASSATGAPGRKESLSSGDARPNGVWRAKRARRGTVRKRPKSGERKTARLANPPEKNLQKKQIRAHHARSPPHPHPTRTGDYRGGGRHRSLPCGPGRHGAGTFFHRAVLHGKREQGQGACRVGFCVSF